uniref:Uncharacterized protein n=1 Tax=Anguilla anguilla TaxID=7936 RepID=A0A0E9RCX9_ANGAN
MILISLRVDGLCLKCSVNNKLIENNWSLLDSYILCQMI